MKRKRTAPCATTAISSNKRQELGDRRVVEESDLSESDHTRRLQSSGAVDGTDSDDPSASGHLITHDQSWDPSLELGTNERAEKEDTNSTGALKSPQGSEKLLNSLSRRDRAPPRFSPHETGGFASSFLQDWQREVGLMALSSVTPGILSMIARLSDLQLVELTHVHQSGQGATRKAWERVTSVFREAQLCHSASRDIDGNDAVAVCTNGVLESPLKEQIKFIATLRQLIDEPIDDLTRRVMDETLPIRESKGYEVDHMTKAEYLRTNAHLIRDMSRRLLSGRTDRSSSQSTRSDAEDPAFDSVLFAGAQPEKQPSNEEINSSSLAILIESDNNTEKPANEAVDSSHGPLRGSGITSAVPQVSPNLAQATIRTPEPLEEQNAQSAAEESEYDEFDMDTVTAEFARAAHAALSREERSHTSASSLIIPDLDGRKSAAADPEVSHPGSVETTQDATPSRIALQTPLPEDSSTIKEQYEKARKDEKDKASEKRRLTQQNSQRRPWSSAEETALMTALDKVQGPHWSQILAMYGAGGTVSDVLQYRSQVQLKDKARNLKLFFLKMGYEVPSYLKTVTGELKSRAPKKMARMEARERLVESSGEDRAAADVIHLLATGARV